MKKNIFYVDTEKQLRIEVEREGLIKKEFL